MAADVLTGPRADSSKYRRKYVVDEIDQIRCIVVARVYFTEVIGDTRVSRTRSLTRDIDVEPVQVFRLIRKTVFA